MERPPTGCFWPLAAGLLLLAIGVGLLVNSAGPVVGVTPEPVATTTSVTDIPTAVWIIAGAIGLFLLLGTAPGRAIGGAVLSGGGRIIPALGVFLFVLMGLSWIVMGAVPQQESQAAGLPLIVALIAGMITFKIMA